jgi:hypothetical protein
VATSQPIPVASPSPTSTREPLRKTDYAGPLVAFAAMADAYGPGYTALASQKAVSSLGVRLQWAFVLFGCGFFGLKIVGSFMACFASRFLRSWLEGKIERLCPLLRRPDDGTRPRPYRVAEAAKDLNMSRELIAGSGVGIVVNWCMANIVCGWRIWAVVASGLGAIVAL